MKVIGIDIGTTSISIGIIDEKTDEFISSVTIDNDTTIEVENNYEKLQDPIKILDKVDLALKNLEISSDDIFAIGITCQMHGILYVDENGDALSPLYTWQDGSGDLLYDGKQSYAEYLTNSTGYKMATGFGALTYFVHSHKKLVPEKATSICTIGDFVAMKLSQKTTPLLDATNAASLGLFDIVNNSFDKDAIDKIGLNYNLFPKVAAKFQLMGYTKEGIKVSTAIGDNQASFIGAMNKREDDILINVGTSSQMSFLVSEYTKLDGMEVRPFVDGRYLLAATPLCGGKSYAILENFYETSIKSFLEFMDIDVNFNKNDIYKWMDNILSKADFSKKQKVNVETTFGGKRENPEKRGSITNINMTNLSPEILAYGFLEGIVDELYLSFENCDKDLKTKAKFLVGSGNAIHNNMHLQKLFEEKFGLEMMVEKLKEDAACGAAMFAKRM